MIDRYGEGGRKMGSVLLRYRSPLMAHRVVSPRRSNLVAFGAKRTFNEPLTEPDL
jgi:hypothetical protein